MEFSNSIIEALPEAAVLVRRWRTGAFNTLAGQYVPGLREGERLPEALRPLLDISSDGGIFTAGQSVYAFRRVKGEGEGELLLLFRPAPQTALTGDQLDGALRQFRQLMAELMTQLDGKGDNRGGVQKSLHRMFRLLDNLDLLRACSEGEPPFSPVAMDLAGLCRQTAEAAGTVLREIGVSLTCDAPASLLISGDPELLRRMLLELLANAAKALGHGRVWVQLRAMGSRAVLTVSDNGRAVSPRQLAALLEQDGGEALPLPGQGAGLGMAVVRRIAALHRGALMVEWSSGAPAVILSLPAGPGEGRTQVSTPRLQRDGGFSPLLVALSDLLPAGLFRQEARD